MAEPVGLSSVDYDFKDVFMSTNELMVACAHLAKMGADDTNHDLVNRMEVLEGLKWAQRHFIFAKSLSLLAGKLLCLQQHSSLMLRKDGSRIVLGKP